MINIFFHIGLHKTGSTFLQKEVFTNMHKLNFLGKLPIEMKNIIYQDILYFDKEFQKQVIKKKLTKYKTNLISNEALSGDPQNGGFYRERILEKIHECFPYAKIILFIRRQDEWALSNYKGSIRNGSNLSLKNFFLPALNPDKSWIRRYPNPTIEIFKFFPYIRYMVKLFGRDNCLIIPYELLKLDINHTIKKLCSFMGIQKPVYTNTIRNYSYGKYRLYINRFFNLFFEKNQNPYGFLKGIPIYNWKHRRFELRKLNSILENISIKEKYDKLFNVLDKEYIDKEGICTRILNLCKYDNKSIQEEFSIDIKRFGYF